MKNHNSDPASDPNTQAPVASNAEIPLSHGVPNSLEPPDSDVTRLLTAWQDGNQTALEELLPMVYDELRRLARRQMRSELGERTLQPTGLVHEAYVRLVGMDVSWQCRGHFFAVATRQMRRILVDEARKKGRLKRGGARPLSLDQLAAEPLAGPSQRLIDLDMALEKLAHKDERKAKVLDLRLFGGLTIEETARMLDVSAATVERELKMARAWLARELEDG